MSVMGDCRIRTMWEREGTLDFVIILNNEGYDDHDALL